MSRCMPTECLATFEAYGKRNYGHVKAAVEAIQAFWGDGVSKELRLWQDLSKKLGVFPCRSFNLGEQTASFPHLDMRNLAQSWCSITPLGNFNPDLGGHLVLWDFGLFIRFPAGSTVLIPSSLLVHSNSSIQPGETRYSIVQYAAGGLFRWVDNGFKTDREWLAGASDDDIKVRQKEKGERWRSAAGMYTHLSEL
jgi:hypothetical protein